MEVKHNTQVKISNKSISLKTIRILKKMMPH